MAKIKLTYDISVIVDIPLDEEFVSEEDGITSEEELSDVITDYFKYDAPVIDYIPKQDDVPWDNDIIVEVIDFHEEFEKYKHVIVPEEFGEIEQSPLNPCCIGKTSNYCPECGRKLK